MRRERFVPAYKQRRLVRQLQARSLRIDWAGLHRNMVKRWRELASERQTECDGPVEVRTLATLDPLVICSWKGGVARPCERCPHSPRREETSKLVFSIRGATERELAAAGQRLDEARCVKASQFDAFMQAGEGCSSPENQALLARVKELRQSAPFEELPTSPPAHDAARRSRSALLLEAVRDFLGRSR